MRTRAGWGVKVNHRVSEETDDDAYYQNRPVKNLMYIDQNRKFSSGTLLPRCVIVVQNVIVEKCGERHRPSENLRDFYAIQNIVKSLTLNLAIQHAGVSFG